MLQKVITHFKTVQIMNNSRSREKKVMLAKYGPDPRLDVGSEGRSL